MQKHYTDEKNVQVILSLLKAHGIRKVVASPGTTNMALVGSMQQDSYFEMYSSVDERSAAYIACGLASESGEPVVLSCTGATASRNYLPGLTEAYYRKLPILAITSMQSFSKVGHHIAQTLDRSTPPQDTVKYSVALPIVKDDDDLWDCEIKVNKAILELKHHGGGPVHINLPTQYSKNYSVQELPKARYINRIMPTDKFPELPKDTKIAVFVGSHPKWNNEQSEALDRFCAANNAVVFCDHTSSYKGKYRVLFALAAGQQAFDKTAFSPDILIHIGEISGDYYSLKIVGQNVWRVSEDGEIRDTFRKLRYVFEMPEQSFFEYYARNGNAQHTDTYLQVCKAHFNTLSEKIPELPLSNIWIASQMAHKIPEGSTIHFGILNSLRSWNFFELPTSVTSASNVGGFGIDGNVSSLLGASLVNKNKLYFGIVGDLAFFYDINAIGNRHIGNNLRLLLVNNGKGTEFRQYNHVASHFDEDADKFIAAAGHYGNKSPELVKNYAQSLGFKYLSATSKEEFEDVFERFLSPEITEKPILFEVFTDSVDESMALELMLNIDGNIKGKAREIAKQVLGKKGLDVLKKVIGK
ncbi:thiamine pyrophosphate-binding protein [Runella zeae]|uniref:thiamine pyrophosphate-binding protein n=1 Tax=Runella zeae TaxID=94255 RepID=UPI002353D77C|nr:thiamine pyrophosphate-binding protein [Runella zeae]